MSLAARRSAVLRPALANRDALKQSLRLGNSACIRRTIGTVSSVEPPSATITSKSSRGKSCVRSDRRAGSIPFASLRTGTMTLIEGIHVSLFSFSREAKSSERSGCFADSASRLTDSLRRWETWLAEVQPAQAEQLQHSGREDVQLQ